MAGDKQSELRYLGPPPPGFAVLRESELDPEHGRSDRWMCRGIVNGRSLIRSGLCSRSSACRAGWFVYDDDTLASSIEPEFTDVAEADIAVAEALARRPAVRRERLAEESETTMREW